MTLVVDASVAVKWGVLEIDALKAKALIGGGRHLIAPELVVAELTNTLWKKIRRGELVELERAAAMAACIGGFDELCPVQDLAPHALDLAVSLQHPAYDCFYLALAEARGATFVTTDARLLDRLTKGGWAGKFEAL